MDVSNLIPLVAILMLVFIAGIVFWYKVRAKGLRAHQELCRREMGHQRKMKELGLEKAWARSAGVGCETEEPCRN